MIALALNATAELMAKPKPIAVKMFFVFIFYVLVLNPCPSEFGSFYPPSNVFSLIPAKCPAFFHFFRFCFNPTRYRSFLAEMKDFSAIFD